MKKRVLVVDDEQIIHDIVGDCIGTDYDVTDARDVRTGIAALDEDVPDVLITDMRMPGGTGLDLVRHALAQYPDLAVIVVTGHGTLDDFIAAFRMGVADFVLKPFTPSTLRRSILRGLETRRLRAENARLRAAALPSGEHELLGNSPALMAVKEKLVQVAATDATVLLTGASGTGKELAARMVHARSTRAAGPFVAVHCGALPESLLESELFGHVRGAFTSAETQRVGRIQEASGGTLFLDEVGTMTPATQVRLLRVLATGEVTPVGADAPRPVDVRVVAATNVDLGELVRAGRFRTDLRYRLEVFPIAMPRLAQRPSDIPLLAHHFLRRACERIGRPARVLSQAAVRRLVAHSWPGNVRELQNIMERAAIFAPHGDAVEAGDLLLPYGRTPGTARIHVPEEGMDLPAHLLRVEADLIAQALERSGGNRQSAAALLGLHRSTLNVKLKRSAVTGQAAAPPPA